ncbi:MAG: acyltransferase [Acidobacteria bacterium]|nr:acyltransferase [Acidobacteriota bacterium]
MATLVSTPEVRLAAPALRSGGKRFYHPELDVLRFFAFFLVFIHHHYPATPGQYNPGLGKLLALSVSTISAAGGFGVDIFFALSSYLITELLLREKESTGGVDVRAFYLRRILRIWPLYFFFLTLAVLLNHWVPGEPVSAKAVLAFLLFSGNWWMIFAGSKVSIINPLWSVSVEEQFYLAWPPLARNLSRRGMLLAAGILLGVASSARLLIGLLHIGSERYLWFNTFTRLDPIALGIVLAVLLRGRSPVLSWIQRAGLFFASVSVLLASASLLHTRAEPVHLAGIMLGYPLVAVSSIGLLVSLLSATAPWYAWTPLVYLGRISYGLYVFHLLGLQLAFLLGHHFPAGPRLVKGDGILGLLLTLLMAALSYRFLEKPFLRIKERYAHVLSRPGG